MKPAIEASAPARTKFMANLTIDTSNVAAVMERVPAEQARIAELKKEGTLLNLWLAADNKRAFIELSAPNEAAARAALASLPLHQFMKVDLVALRPV